LTARGWACGVFTGPNLDDPRAAPVGERLRGEGVRVDRGRFGALEYALLSSARDGYPVTVFAPDPPAARRPPTPEEARAFAGALERVVRTFRPAVVLTYGGDPASRAVLPVGRSAGARVVLWLHNLAYRDAGFFRGYDAVVVPSEFARSHYQTRSGTECVALPPVLDPDRTTADPAPDPVRYATYVNPEPAKGVYWFARIADVLGRRRPDVPLLVVEGRGRIDWLDRCGVDLSRTRSVHRMRNTGDPRQFYRVSSLVLAPSLVGETFGRVAVEAMLNGVPVLASDRGALPETVGAGGVVLPIPERFTPATREAPSEDEVAPWVEAIIRAWDDPVWFESRSAAAREAARRWQPEVVVPRWESFLSGVTV
jgi:glycosyltransferase involved in cell wall biosynthesis